jgi:radical SAM superfamily enzyme YgiQ (UPF0313 family)
MYNAVIFTECNGSIGWGRDAGAYTVASQLRSVGYSVKTIDFFSFFDFEKFKNVIDKFVSNDTLFLGFSCTHFSTLLPHMLERHWLNEFDRDIRNTNWNVYFPFYPPMLERWFEYAKNKYPQLKIIVGGQKVSQKVALQQQYPMVDIWVAGMADVSIIAIADNLSDGMSLKKNIKSEYDYPKYNECDFCKSSINWNKQDDNIFPFEALPIEIARWCPFKCAFCDFPKKKKGTWIKTEETLSNELYRNYEQFGTTDYAIMDYQINESVEKMEMIHRVFTSMPFKVHWTGFCRLELIHTHPEMIDMIYESGARSIMWGIETINPATGPIVSKNTKLSDIENALTKCRAKWGNDVIMGSGFVLGLPGESIESCNEMIDWLETQTLLDGWEMCPLFIGDYDPNKEYTIDYSKIQKDPIKYGYDVKMEKVDGRFIETWHNNGMTKSKMIDLINKSYNAKSRDRRSLITNHGYLRCQNIGFKHDELLDATYANKEWFIEYINKYRDLAELYFKQVGI